MSKPASIGVMSPRDGDSDLQPAGGFSPHSAVGRLALYALDGWVGGVQVGKALAARNPPILPSRASDALSARCVIS